MKYLAFVKSVKEAIWYAQFLVKLQYHKDTPVLS